MKMLYFFLLGALPLMKLPQADISNGIIKAKLYLPDPQKGYYQGTRFDHSGNMESLVYKGHNYFSQWFPKYSPEIHDAIMGPVEEFTSPDYQEARPGGNFLKIGVGELKKIDDSPYSFRAPFEIVNAGKWRVKPQADKVEFIHELKGEKYSYQYEKIISLTKDKPEMVISHTLKNTGNRTIETSVYNHNFFTIDKQQIGPGIEISFPFNIYGTGSGLGEIAEFKGNKIIFLRQVKTGEDIFVGGLTGFSDKISDHDIKIENHITGAGVRITCDQPFLKINFWSCSTTACPEPYISIKADPGQEISWNIKYEFYTFEPDKQLK